jgi:TetR/AcrR family transcriptional regulator
MAATADRILAEARGEFARRGFSAARLQDIAERAGLSHPTLLYHFGSKERLYEAVIEQAVHDWAQTTRRAISTGLRGFDQVAALLEAGFEFFAGHHDLVVIVQREAIDGGGRLEQAIADHMRPFLEDAIAFLEREMRAGRLRRQDPAELLELCYSALLTHFSVARFRARLFGEQLPDERFLRALTEILRAALEPAPR